LHLDLSDISGYQIGLPKITVIGFIASFVHCNSGRLTKIFNIREETIGIWRIEEN